MLIRFCVLAAALLASLTPALAQSGSGEPSPGPSATVAGQVTDADTGEPLPGATVQLDGTFVGTVTNRDGQFVLDLAGRMGALVVRYIGYETARVQPAGERLDVALVPSALELGEVVVSGEDPAVQLMRRVIEQKQTWREAVRSWQADAYVRYVVLADGEIAAIKEVATEAFWDRERGLAEQATAARTTDNLAATPGPLAAAAALVDLYDDEVEFAGFTLPGVTGPDALGFYRFEITGQRVQDGVPVYDVSVRPKSDLQPGFVGTLAVLDRPAALLEVRLGLSEAVRLPLVQDLSVSYGQAFSPFGQEEGGAYLPVDFRFDASGTPGMAGLRFPPSGFRVNARLSGYALNVPVPDSLYAEDEAAETRTARADSLALTRGQEVERPGVAIPLEQDEEAAYAELDSADRVVERFRPTGPLARFVSMSVNGESTQSGDGRTRRVRFRPDLWYNRVEGAHLGAGVRLGKRTGPFVRGSGAYLTAAEDAAFEVSGGWRENAWTLEGGYRDEVARQYGSDTWDRLLSSAAALLGEPDYYDYYGRRGAFASLAYRHRPENGLSLGVAVSAQVEDHESRAPRTGYDLLGAALNALPNPPVDGGRLQSVALRVGAGDLAQPVDAVQRSVTGIQGLSLQAEQSAGGDFSFTRLGAEAAYAVPTFLQRRLLPMTLHLRAGAGTYVGDLPAQRRFAVDGRVLGFAPFGTMRTQYGRPLAGRQYVSGFWEHDFRSVPFELVGWDGAADVGLSLLVGGGHAAVDVGGVTVQHHELSLGLSAGFLLPIRADVSVRLDEPGVAVGIGVARIF